MSMPRALFCVVPVALAVFAVGCDAPLVSECLPGVNPECEPEPDENEIVGGVDVTALFTPPTADEVSAAKARLSSVPTSALTDLAPLADAADGARQYLLTLRNPGDSGDSIASALVRIPGDRASTAPLPVVVVLPDGTDGASATDLLTGAGFGAIETGYVQVVVAYRGEPLRLDGRTVRSTRSPSPYVADVNDVLTFLQALSGVPRADRSRVALVGLGRGGTVALLAAAQSSLADAVVTLGAPTDLFAPSFQDESRAALRGQTPPSPYPAFSALVAPVLAHQSMETNRAEARVELLTFSPARLGLRLPAVLGLHAAGDVVVGDDQLASLRARLTGSPSMPRTTQLIQGPTHDGLIEDAAARATLVQFLRDVL